ncbi:hypothetical protein [Bacillus sp. AFS041924]|uniref:hypothetical protein n=1 Tax=Bacillus sp. AFS041924 TaxID=2033503 RepID=UPI000BFD1BB6|nr:hypothetical protein [Bacillus sp. AFS041924]PGS48414.1 hypothetical protein COC46_18150 [Bacillus sp. AFS041924]
MNKLDLLKDFILNKKLGIDVSIPTKDYTNFSYNGFDAGTVYNNGTYRLSVARGTKVERLFRKRKYKMKVSKDNNNNLVAIFELESAEDLVQVKTLLLNMEKLANNGLREELNRAAN